MREFSYYNRKQKTFVCLFVCVRANINVYIYIIHGYNKEGINHSYIRSFRHLYFEYIIYFRSRPQTIKVLIYYWKLALQLKANYNFVWLLRVYYIVEFLLKENWWNHCCWLRRWVYFTQRENGVRETSCQAQAPREWKQNLWLLKLTRWLYWFSHSVFSSKFFLYKKKTEKISTVARTCRASTMRSNGRLMSVTQIPKKKKESTGCDR